MASNIGQAKISSPRALSNFWSQLRDNEFFNQLQLLHLEDFAIGDNDALQVYSLFNMIQTRQKILKSIELIRVLLVDNQEIRRGDGAKWIRLLKTVKCLRPEAQIVISVPRVLETFTAAFGRPIYGPGYSNWVEMSFRPSEDEDHTDVMQIVDGILNGYDGAHYFSKLG